MGIPVVGRKSRGTMVIPIDAWLFDWKRVQINVSADLPFMTSEALKVLYAANNPPCLFVKDRRIVRVVTDEYGFPYIEVVDEDTLRYRLSRVIKYMSKDKDKNPKEALPPMFVVKSIFALGWWNFPILKGVISVPIVRPDGELITTPGYDAETCLYYVPGRDLSADVSVFDSIHDHLSREDVKEAVNVLKDAYIDFPFAGSIEGNFDGNAEFANNIALVLTMLIKPAIVGNKPMAALIATKSRTGKTLLVQYNHVIAYGGLPALATMPQDEFEWRKFVTTEVMFGSECVVLDNVKGLLNSQTLDKILTSGRHRDRMLGSNTLISMESNIIWVATGNKMSLTKDLTGRTYRILLDARSSHPEKREEFKHPGILEYGLSSRVQILQALYTMVLSWYNADCPMPEKYIRKGGFEEWTRILTGVLYYAGIGGFLTNTEQLEVDADDESDEMEAFLTAWSLDFLDGKVTVKDLYKMIETRDSMLSSTCPKLVAKYAEKGEKAFNSSMGTWLKKVADVRYGIPAMYLTQDGNEGNKKLWKVVVEPEKKQEPEKPEPEEIDLPVDDVLDSQNGHSKTVVSALTPEEEEEWAKL